MIFDADFFFIQPAKLYCIAAIIEQWLLFFKCLGGVFMIWLDDTQYSCDWIYTLNIDVNIDRLKLCVSQTELLR